MKFFKAKVIAWCFALLLFGLSSCTAYKKIPYLKDAESLSQQQLKSVANISEFKVMPKDILSITVNTPTPGIASDFNMPIIPAGMSSVTQSSLSSGATVQNYIVDKEGFIDYPILGKIQIAGLTRAEVESKIKSLVYPKYLKEEPIVNVRFLDLKISVLGEVAKPGVYSATRESLTIFEGLALAGDLTIYGRRDNVMLLRTNDAGEVSIHRINLQDKDILLNQDIYYLQQNDKLIVEVNKTRANNSSIGSLETLGLSAVSILISVIAILTR